MVWVPGAVETIECGTAEELLSRLSPLDERWRCEGGWVYRGQANAEWKLLPSIHRRARWRAYLRPADLKLARETGKRVFFQKYAEFIAVHQFAIKANSSGLPIPLSPYRLRHFKLPEDDDFPARELLELLGLAQHSGVPTRLLDWTRSARVAAYFAAREATARRPDGMLAVWALKRDALHVGGVRAAIAEVPRAANRNLHAQDGVFTHVLGFERPLDLEGIVRKIPRTITYANYRPALRKLVLPGGEAPKLLRFLAYEGVTAAQLFPGYAGVARALDEERRWDQPGATLNRSPDWWHHEYGPRRR